MSYNVFIRMYFFNLLSVTKKKKLLTLQVTYGAISMNYDE